MYDVIAVGARCAGSPTAMLLARAGHRVLLVDRATFPSDTLSTHALKVAACARLARWGLLEQALATNAPPIRRATLDLGPLVLSGAATPLDGIDHGVSVRRTLLDKILVDAAVAAGAELREDFTVTGLLFEDGRVAGIRGHGRGGVEVEERARLVVGADGRHSLVAREVQAPVYNDRPALTCAYYSYWSGVALSGVEFYPRGNRIVIAFPTNDELSIVYTGWPAAEFDAFRADVEGNYLRTIALARPLWERVQAGHREDRIYGTVDLPNYFRKPYGPGWALVGDAGLHCDPILAQGITDAFRDVELLTEAINAGWNRRGLPSAGSVEGSAEPLDAALAGYEQARNQAAMPIFEFVCQQARLEPPPPEMLQLFGALAGNQEQIDRLIGVIDNTVPVQDFFSPENVGRIMAAAGAPAGA